MNLSYPSPSLSFFLTYSRASDYLYFPRFVTASFETLTSAVPREAGACSIQENRRTLSIDSAEAASYCLTDLGRSVLAWYRSPASRPFGPSQFIQLLLESRILQTRQARLVRVKHLVKKLYTSLSSR